MRDTFVRTLIQAATGDPAIALVSGDLGFGVVDEFAQTLPRQFLNAGVAGQNMLGTAATGYRVFVYSIAKFPTLRALEQIRNDACYHDLESPSCRWEPVSPTGHSATPTTRWRTSQ